MGHIHTVGGRKAGETPGRGVAPVRRGFDLVAGTILLVIAAPMMAVLALAVRASSHGPVLHRERVRTPAGTMVELLSFRTMLDGGGTHTHERLRAVVGASATAALTPVGRLLVATRLHRLPRLVNVVAGHRSLLRNVR
jgi:lipopolysaccharide/colanic/teichoic acid biosynthesis glycosyltransferase